ncbi:MAG: IS66 family transposase zinc-finger binding domain-containing protein [Nitrosomonas sp. H1_AOB3]|nr:MAG: IS66 family transposase zinc-finger binding domain-containing protein [Nitrosomonas sp. H1_AOB3]
MVTLQDKDRELVLSKTLNKKLTFEIAVLRRFRFGKRGEQLLPGAQGSLLEEAVDEDTEIETQLAALFPEPDSVSQPNPLKRAALPPQLPRIEIRHEPHDENCPCGCRLTFVRNEISEKLDYTPGTFTVERHARPILACPKVSPTWKINFFPDFFCLPQTKHIFQFCITQISDPFFPDIYSHICQITFGLDHVVDAFLECGTGNQTMYLDVMLLTDTIGPICRLCFNCRIPPEVEVDHIGSGCQVEAGTACFQR